MSRTRVSTNFIYNILGVTLPLALTIVTTPIYLRHIGQERYGVLALIWLVVGYFGLLDLGLSRASANRLARTTTPEETVATFWAAFWTSLLLGCAGGLVLYGGVTLWGIRYFDGKAGLADEVLSALPFLALFIPLATTSGVLIGALESRHRFLNVNAIAIGGSALFAIVPLAAALTISPSLAILIPAATISRLVTVVCLGWSALRALEIGRIARPSRAHVRDLMSYGSWAAISTFIGSMMNTVDQLFIGATLGAAAVAHYVVPYNVVTRMGIFPSALLRALFPSLSKADANTAKGVEHGALMTVCIAMTGLCIALILCFRLLLQLWLRDQLVPISIPVAIILTVGIWFNAIAVVPYWTQQAQGRPDIPAKLHLIEIAPYLLILFLGIRYFGLIGAAVAWAIRMASDAILLCVASKYQRKHFIPLASGAAFILVAAALALTIDDSRWLIGAGILAAPLLFLWARSTDRVAVDRFVGLSRRVWAWSMPGR